MSSRLKIDDAIQQLQASGIKPDVLWQAIEDRRVEVIAERLATFSSEVSHHHRADFPRWPDDGGVYLDASRVSHPTGFIDVAELKDLPDGLSTIMRPPYWWIDRWGDNFHIYSHKRTPDTEVTRTILTASFVKSALILGDGSCTVDDFEALTRTVAYQVTVLSRDIKSLVGVKIMRPHVRPGPKDSYNCEECDSKFLGWTRSNPTFNFNDKIQKFRDIYADHGHTLLSDGQLRREKAALKQLGFISPATERRQNPN